MPWAYKRDPITGDFIKDGRGGWVKTRTSENLVRNQLLAKYQRAWQDPELGSRLHDRERFQAAPAPLIEDEVRRSLGRVQEAGRIASLEVKASSPQAGRVSGSTRFVDVSTGSIVTSKIPVGR